MKINTHYSLLIKRLMRYGIVGAVAFLTELVTFMVLFSAIDSSHKLMIAQTLSFALALIVSFAGSRLFTFSAKMDYRLAARIQMALYFTLAMVNLVISNIFIHLLVENANLMPLYAKIVVMGSVALWNFIIFNKIIFTVKTNR